MTKQKITCEECASTQVYTTLKERVCRRCGYREKLKRRVEGDENTKSPKASDSDKEKLQ